MILDNSGDPLGICGRLRRYRGRMVTTLVDGTSLALLSALRNRAAG